MLLSLFAYQRISLNTLRIYKESSHPYSSMIGLHLFDDPILMGIPIVCSPLLLQTILSRTCLYDSCMWTFLEYKFTFDNGGCINLCTHQFHIHGPISPQPYKIRGLSNSLSLPKCRWKMVHSNLNLNFFVWFSTFCHVWRNHLYFLCCKPPEHFPPGRLIFFMLINRSSLYIKNIYFPFVTKLSIKFLLWFISFSIGLWWFYNLCRNILKF